MSYGLEFQRYPREKQQQALGHQGNQKSRKQAKCEASSSVEDEKLAENEPHESPGEKGHGIGGCQANRTMKIKRQITGHNKPARRETENFGKE
jgi:hypothetical protein